MEHKYSHLRITFHVFVKRYEMLHDSGWTPPLPHTECYAVIAERMGCEETVPCLFARRMLKLSSKSTMLSDTALYTQHFLPMCSLLQRAKTLMSYLRAWHIATEKFLLPTILLSFSFEREYSTQCAWVMSLVITGESKADVNKWSTLRHSPVFWRRIRYTVKNKVITPWAIFVVIKTGT